MNETRLVDAVLEWWEQHEYDSSGCGMDEFNVYESDPEFVAIAKKIKSEQ